MKPFVYHRPDTPEAAVAATQADGQGAAYLAGGTTIIDLMKLHVMTPDALTDVTSVLPVGIEEQDGGLRVGAATTMATAAEHPAFQDRAPVLSEALWKAAAPQIRNVATLGGNVLQRTRCPYFRDVSAACNKREPGSGCDGTGGINRLLAVLGTSDDCIATYAGDWANALVLFDAEVELLGPDGTRTLPFADLHRMPGDSPEIETTLEDGELITAFNIPMPGWAWRSTYTKVRDRESYAFAVASAAVMLDMDGDTISEARIGLGGVATTPWRARAAEDYLAGKTLTEEVGLEAGRIAFADARGWGHNDFKIELGRRTVLRGLVEAAAKTQGGGR